MLQLKVCSSEVEIELISVHDFCTSGDLNDTCCFMKHKYSLSHWIQHWSRTQDIVIHHLARLFLWKINRKLTVLWSAAKLAGEQTPPKMCTARHSSWRRGLLELLTCAVKFREECHFFHPIWKWFLCRITAEGTQNSTFMYFLSGYKSSDMWIPYVDLSSNDFALIKETPFSVW